MQVGADRLIPPLVDLGRTAERLPARTRGRLRCHTADLPGAPGCAQDGRRRRVVPRTCPSMPVKRRMTGMKSGIWIPSSFGHDDITVLSGFNRCTRQKIL